MAVGVSLLLQFQLTPILWLLDSYPTSIIMINGSVIIDKITCIFIIFIFILLPTTSIITAKGVT
jgi:hypothetical protein